MFTNSVGKRFQNSATQKWSLTFFEEYIITILVCHKFRFKRLKSFYSTSSLRNLFFIDYIFYNSYVVLGKRERT